MYNEKARSRGSSFGETGILVGLIAVVTIGAVAFLGEEVSDTFCGVRASVAAGLGLEPGDCAVSASPGDPVAAEPAVVNLPPVFSGAGNLGYLSFAAMPPLSVAAVDPEGREVSYAVNPQDQLDNPWLSVDPATGAVSIDPALIDTAAVLARQAGGAPATSFLVTASDNDPTDPKTANQAFVLDLGLPTDCQALYAVGARDDGIYGLLSGALAPAGTYCKFIADGSSADGGWELMMSAPLDATFGYDDPAWVSRIQVGCHDVAGATTLCSQEADRNRQIDVVAQMVAKYAEPLGALEANLTTDYRSPDVQDRPFGEILFEAVSTAGDELAWVAYGMGRHASMGAFATAEIEREYLPYASSGMPQGVVCGEAPGLPYMSFLTEDTDQGRFGRNGGYYAGFTMRLASNEPCPYDDGGATWTGRGIAAGLPGYAVTRVFSRNPDSVVAATTNLPPIIQNPPPLEYATETTRNDVFVVHSGVGGRYRLPAAIDPEGGQITWGNYRDNSSNVDLVGDEIVVLPTFTLTEGVAAVMSALDDQGAARTIRVPIAIRYATSCDALYERAAINSVSVSSGLFRISPSGDASYVVEYCHFETSGPLEGGWTVVAFQREDTPKTDWTTGIAINRSGANYFNTGFTLSSAQIPAHEHVAFGRRFLADGAPANTIEVLDAVAMTYGTGDLSLIGASGALRGLMNPSTYYDVHRSTTGYFGSHDPDPVRSPGTSGLWNNSLTFDVRPGGPGSVGDLATETTWAFSPLHNIAIERGFAYNGLAQTIDNVVGGGANNFGWIVMVR